MNKSRRLVYISVVGVGLGAGGYLGWWGSQPGAASDGTAPPWKLGKVSDGNVALEVLEGAFAPRPDVLAGILEDPMERFRVTLEEVARLRRIKPDDLQDEIDDWIKQVERKDGSDNYHTALALYHIGDYTLAAKSALTAYQKALRSPQVGKRVARQAALVRGKSLLLLQQYAEAAKTYANVISLTDLNDHLLGWVQAQEARAYALYHLNQFEEMEKAMELALQARSTNPGINDIGTCHSLIYLALSKRKQKKVVEAEAVQRQGAELMLQTVGVRPEHKYEALCVLARDLVELKRVAEAEPCLQKALEVARSSGDEAGINPGQALLQLGHVYRVLKRPENAMQWYQQAVEAFEKQGTSSQTQLGMSLASLSNSLMDLKMYDEAVAAAQRAVQIMQTAPGGDDFDLAGAYAALGLVYVSAQRFDEAETTLRQAIQEMESKYGPDDPRLSPLLGNLGTLLWRSKRLEEAEPLFWDAVAMDFHESAATNQVTPNLAIHLRQFVNLMADRGVPNTEVLERIKELGNEARMSQALFDAALAAEQALGN